MALSCLAPAADFNVVNQYNFLSSLPNCVLFLSSFKDTVNNLLRLFKGDPIFVL